MEIQKNTCEPSQRYHRQILIDRQSRQRHIQEQLKKAQISNKDVINFLRREIKKYEEAIKIKEDTIHQLQKQIQNDQLQIAEFQNLIPCF